MGTTHNDHTLHKSFHKESNSNYDNFYVKELEKDSNLHFAYGENDAKIAFGFYDTKSDKFEHRYVVISKEFHNMYVWSKKADGKWMCMLFRGRDGDKTVHYFTKEADSNKTCGYYVCSQDRTKGSYEISRTLKNTNKASDGMLFVETDTKDIEHEFSHLFVYECKNGEAVWNPYMKTMANFWCKVTEDKNGNETYNQKIESLDVFTEYTYESVWVPYAEPEFVDFDCGWRWGIDNFTRGPHQNFIGKNGTIYYEDFMHDWYPLTPKDAVPGHDILIESPNGIRFYFTPGEGGYMLLYEKNKKYKNITGSLSDESYYVGTNKGWVICSKYIYGGAINTKTMFYDRHVQYKNVGLYYSTNRIEILRMEYGRPLAGVIIEGGLKLHQYIKAKEDKSSNMFYDD